MNIQLTGLPGDVRGRIMQTEIGFEIGPRRLADHLAVVVGMKSIHHGPIVPAELPNLLADGLTEFDKRARAVHGAPKTVDPVCQFLGSGNAILVRLLEFQDETRTPSVNARLGNPGPARSLDGCDKATGMRQVVVDHQLRDPVSHGRAQDLRKLRAQDHFQRLAQKRCQVRRTEGNLKRARVDSEENSVRLDHAGAWIGSDSQWRSASSIRLRDASVLMMPFFSGESRPRTSSSHKAKTPIVAARDPLPNYTDATGIMRTSSLISVQNFILVADGAAVFAWVGPADQDAVLEVDADRLVAAEAAGGLDQVVPLGLELAADLGGDARLQGDRAAALSAGWPVGSDEPKWRNRGASPASCTSMPKSIMLQITCACPWACMSPPIKPKLSQGWPSLVTKPGMIVWNGRLRGSRRLRCWGSSANSEPRF